MNFFSFIIKNKFPDRTTRTGLLKGPYTLLHVILFVLIGSTLALAYSTLITLNNRALVTVPAQGGTLTEGIIGAPRFLNPVLAMTETDTALSKLIFGGLMKESPEGEVVPDIAKEYTLSPDARTYTFYLRPDVHFHDGSPLTAHDVAFTIQMMQNPLINTLSANTWQQIKTTVIDPSTISVTIPEPKTNFVKEMTLGIIPASLWTDIPPETVTLSAYNLKPIGSGPFKVKSISFENDIPTEITLTRSRFYKQQAPHIKTLTIKIFANQETLFQALENEVIDFTTDILPQTIAKDTLPKNYTVTLIPTNDILGIYRHEGSSALAYAPLLSLINAYIDRTAIIDTVENSYGIPYVPGNLSGTERASLEETLNSLSRLGYTVTNGVLTKSGTPVVLSIATLSDTRLSEAARALTSQLASLGIITEIKAFDSGTFQDELARGTFSLVLTKGTRTLPTSYVSGIPLYLDSALLVTNKKAKGIAPSTLDSPTLRYATIASWHERTDKVYRWLIKQQ